MGSNTHTLSASIPICVYQCCATSGDAYRQCNNPGWLTATGLIQYFTAFSIAALDYTHWIRTYRTHGYRSTDKDIELITSIDWLDWPERPHRARQHWLCFIALRNGAWMDRGFQLTQIGYFVNSTQITCVRVTLAIPFTIHTLCMRVYACFESHITQRNTKNAS